MTYLHPIQPFLIVPPTEGEPCLDRNPGSERERHALAAREPGLPALLSHPDTPDHALRGVADGMWAPAGGPAVFLHREEYPIEQDVVKTRWSVVVGLDLERSPLVTILSASRDAVDAHVGHLRAAGVDPGGISVLYRDEEQLLDKLVEARGELPPLLTLSSDIARHQVWALSADEGEAMLRFLESCRATIVGDIALYRAMLRLRQEPGFASPRPVVSFFNQREFGVTLASTALIYPDYEGFDINRFSAFLHQQFEVTEFRVSPLLPSDLSHREFFDSVRTEGITQRVVGVLVYGVPTALLVKVPDGNIPGINSDVPEAALEYDAEWVERALVRPFFPPSVTQPRRVLVNPRAAPRELEDAGGGIALILNPPPKRHIPDLADLGWRLPGWALEFRPPTVRGLFMAPLRPQSHDTSTREQRSQERK